MVPLLLFILEVRVGYQVNTVRASDLTRGNSR